MSIAKNDKPNVGIAREHGLDLFRGICLLGIILEHTCLISGLSYIPLEWGLWTMLLDLPALFFISGMTLRTINRDMIINSLFKLACVFTLLSVILNALYGRFSWDFVLKPLFLTAIDLPEFYLSAQQAYWFVPLYAGVLIIATIILKKIRCLYGAIMLFCLGLYFYCFFAHTPFPEGKFFGESLQHIFFYLSVFLFGFFCKDKVIGRIFQKEAACLLLILAIGVYYLTYLFEGEFIFNLFLNKFPVRLPFVAVSFVSIAVFIFFYRAELKNRFLEYIGQNAVYYYAGQGIGSVMLQIVVPHVVLAAYLKLPLMFMLNIVITSAVALLLKLIYGGLGYIPCFLEKRFLSK